MEIPGYDVKHLIGQGGMATAYLAEQKSLGRQVVLKILDSSVNESPETVERFLNEGRIIASLNHPHIITIYDIGQSGDKVYISMEFVEGGDLKQRMMHKIYAPVEAIDVLEKIAAGLAAAHENGIVHRDVKPGNILFRRDGTPLLSDFGIAKRLSGDSDLTSTGMFLGSPNYMAPEQSEAGPIDGRADIYALGVILFEMLTGERAYSADSVIDVIVMHKKAPIPTLPAGLEPFQELLNLMMAKERNDRFRDAQSLIHYIDQMRKVGTIKSRAEMTDHPDFDVTREDEIEGETTSPVTRITLEHRRSPLGALPLGKLAMVGMLVLCGIGWGILLYFEKSMETPAIPRVVTPAAIENVALAPPAGASEKDGEAPADGAQIAQALLWLGRHSLDDFRLTAPPRDNAYYYFSRLLQINPDDAQARAGIIEISARYAMLAEREIAQDNFETARSYIGIGLQIDPANEALRLLKELAAPKKVGFFDALASLFK
jgi:tRNA A-37 threonylcarbamoyl transferase component Bud32